MQFSEIIGQSQIKKHLTYSADNDRIAHAQLFVGSEGVGTLSMALAYAQYVLCKNTNGENQGGNPACNLKFEHNNHPDLHFAYPVATNQHVKKNPTSKYFAKEWKQFITEQAYGSLFDWYQLIGIDNKQGQIRVDEAAEIIKALSLKSYEGGYKIMLIWRAEKLNTAAANKLLKLIEEPNGKTLFILITESEEQIISTIRSRCQIVRFPPLPEIEIQKGLENRGLQREQAKRIAQQANGNFNKALDLINKNSEELIFEKWFVTWLRTAYKAKGNKAAITNLLLWSQDLAQSGRETQKKFLSFCTMLFRQALLCNYKAEDLLFYKPYSSDFQIKKLAPFIHDNNIVEITEALQKASIHIERNANAKIAFTDLSIQLTRLIHQKSKAVSKYP